MPYLVCGLGQAGGKIVDEMFGHPHFARIATPFAINATAKDLSLLRNIPRAHWVGVSEDKGLIEGTVEGFESHVVGGFGKNPQRADEVMKKNYDKVVSFFTEYAWKHALASEEEPVEAAPSQDEWETVDDDAEDLDWVEERESIPFALLVVGLGGGTGCGIAGRIAQAIRDSSSVDTTILAVAVLPATFDASGARTGAGRQAVNAVFALNNIEPHVDGLILVDNEALAHTGTPETHFDDFNQFVAKSMVDLLGAHLVEKIDMSRLGTTALPMIDIQDIRTATTLPAKKKGKATKRTPGYVSLGWAAAPTRGLGAHILGLGRHRVDLDHLIQTCLRKQTLVGINPDAAQKSLGLLRLPVPMLRRARDYPQTAEVEHRLARSSALNEVHFGITATRRHVASLTTLLTYERGQIDRIARLEALAKEYEKAT